MDQKPSINIYHKLLEGQLGKHRQNTSYYKMYKIGKASLKRQEERKELARRAQGFNSRAFQNASWRHMMSQRVFKKQLKATVRGFGGDPDFFVSNK